jgi:hypothetical protein
LLQSRNVRLDSSELLLCEFKNSLAGSTTSVTGFQDLSQFCQCEADTKCSLDDKHSFTRSTALSGYNR